MIFNNPEKNKTTLQSLFLSKLKANTAQQKLYCLCLHSDLTLLQYDICVHVDAKCILAL